MNLSPCFDKVIPILWTPKQEPETYLTIESVTPQLEYVPDSVILGGGKITLEPGKTLLIEGELLAVGELPFIGTMVPLTICLSEGRQKATNVVVSLHYSSRLYPELLFLDKTSPCAETYPMRRNGHETLRLEMFGDLSDDPRVELHANYSQILRESAIHCKWLVLTLTFSISLFLHFLL